MNRLPEQLVAWHNRHPLALRITLNDVHTVGVVALPFMRSGSMAAGSVTMPARMIEPVFNERESAETADEPSELHESVSSGESVSTPDADPQSAAAALPSTPAPQPAAAPPRWQLWRRSGSSKTAGAQRTWPVFSERFVERLSARSISRFAQACGFATRPGAPTWPVRQVAIDDDLLATADAANGARPVELYLVSAAIDASAKRRTRVLIGQGKRDDTLAVLGKRCLSPLRVGGLALALLLLVGGAASAALWWPRGEVLPEATAPVSAAAALPAEPAQPAQPASAPRAEAASSASSALVAASAAAALLTSSGSELEAVPEAAAASEPTPDIRPRLVERVFLPRARQPTRAMLAPPEPASAAAGMPLEKMAEAKPAKPDEPNPSASKAMPSSKSIDVDKRLSTGQPVVALVGPTSANKADAEALLERLRAAVEGVQGKSNTALQASVFQTADGWRAAIWPFGSREEAQIINATLVARGMKTRAVDF